ncbi:hypothetical protein [Acrocarpospora catenulata]|uniref:hypothetical protein n=1 Tax=Acrocarpospora catenulata TaxID=2836182 RepID=UPI001BDAE95B|nr:hypothetical protein [Acrocarpospora catenulata]
MIRRLFWLGLGAYLALWVERKLRALAPDHLARRTAGELAGFAADVRDAALTRENELRARYALDTLGNKRPQTHHYHDVRDGR